MRTEGLTFLSASTPIKLAVSFVLGRWAGTPQKDSSQIDHTPSIDRPADLGKIARIGQEGVKVFLGESTNARASIDEEPNFPGTTHRHL